MAINDAQRLKIKQLVYELHGEGVTREEFEEEADFYLKGAEEDAE